MSLGEVLRLTLFGTKSAHVLARFLEGVPKGVTINPDLIQQAMDEEKPGGRYASKRKGRHIVELISGVNNSVTTGEMIEISIKNSDAKNQRNYSFLPNQPRPSHPRYSYDEKN